MPNQRAHGQKQIPVMMKEDFVDTIDSALAQLGYTDRAKFIRDAVFEKLENSGIKLPREISLAPDRAGKGGRPTHLKTHSLEKAKKRPNSKPVSEAARILKKAAGQE